MALAVALAALGAGCGGSDAPESVGSPQPRTTTGAQRPPAQGTVLAAVAALPGGRYLTGELTSGIVREQRTGPVLARLALATGGQRGLLGLAAAPDGRTIWASYTAADGGRLVVERLRPSPRRRVWTGPVGTALATGGHLLYDDARDVLLIGVGDLQDPSKVTDPDAPNGKLLALDPDGPADQAPVVLSLGWNNPFAFARTPGGTVWVVDNAPGERPERIARGTTGGGPPDRVTELRGTTAASGVVALGERTLAVCGVVAGRLDRYDYETDTAIWRRGGVLDDDCRYGVTQLTDGRLAVSGARGIHVIDRPGGPTP